MRLPLCLGWVPQRREAAFGLQLKQMWWPQLGSTLALPLVHLHSHWCREFSTSESHLRKAQPPRSDEDRDSKLKTNIQEGPFFQTGCFDVSALFFILRGLSCPCLLLLSILFSTGGRGKDLALVPRFSLTATLCHTLMSVYSHLFVGGQV